MADSIEKNSDFELDVTPLYSSCEECAECDKGKNILYETESGNNKRAVLVSVYSKKEESEATASLDELRRLADTADVECVGVITQVRDKPDGRTCLGKGKLEELYELICGTGVELVVFDTELSPMQISAVEAELSDSVSVIDRSMLILDIFASHATTAEGRLQVELAQLKYTAPRLAGKGAALSRLGGGIGTRGPGESKLEIDRRRLRSRIHALEEELSHLEDIRLTQRRSRDRSGVMKCAVVGYTNAGKSTLMNALTDAGIHAEDKLFATLDPTTRFFDLPSGNRVLLTDTVGFIRKLPHHLIKAFKSTLDEAVYADILIIVCDAGDELLASQIEVTRNTLQELGALGKPILFVFNKCDTVSDESRLLSLKSFVSGGDETCVFVSAVTGEGLDTLVCSIEALASDGKHTVTLKIPISDGAAVSYAYSNLENVDLEYGNEFVEGCAVADAKSAGRLKNYIIDYDIVFPPVE